ncbi:MAG: ATP-binding cassette domain-containing protein [Actinomycetota bacterium]
MTTDAPAIIATGLKRTFKGDVEAVRGVDLDVHRGEVFGFLGPNGAGKTTTVRMLCTLLPITAGVAQVAGIDVRSRPADVRRKIGVALQEIGLDPLQTGRELLTLQAALYGMNSARSKARAGELLELVGLTEAGDRRLKTYSGGMKRRLDLASALVHEPEVLFLDEPTTGLDPASRITVWDEVRRINATGTTVFLTTQYLEEADVLCARIAIIDEGLIVSRGTPGELKSKLGHDVVLIKLPDGGADHVMSLLQALEGVDRAVVDDGGVAAYVDNGSAAVPVLVRALDEANVRVGAISISSPSLDDVFLQATGHRLEGAENSTGAATTDKGAQR